MAIALTAVVRQDERAFRALANAAPVMLWTAQADGLCNFFNARWLAFCGAPAHALLGHAWLELVHPHDRARRQRRYERAVRKRGAFALDSRWRRGDGEWRWLREQAEPYRDAAGRFAGFVGFAYDTTDYRRAQAALQDELSRSAALERALLLRLADAQESERRRLSTELHDRAGEPLTALRLELAALQRSDLPPAAREHLEHCLGHARGAIDAMGEAMTELRPPMLDEFGLAAALRWYGEQLGSRSGLEIVVSVPQEPPRLAPQVESALFRIAQECLRNVVRHARASYADVTLSHEGARSATLRIEDDGVGFAGDAAEPAWRWGLLTMRERACAIGARIDLVSQPGEGTCVTVTLEE